MDTIVENKCRQLAENYALIRKGNALENQSLKAAAAAIYLIHGVPVDPERLKAARKLLKRKKGIFSNYRGISEFIVRTRMALSEDPEAYLDELDEVYRGLRTFLSGEQTLLAAMVLADLTAPGKRAAAVEDTRALYKVMRKAHPWLTSEDDMPFAAMMAATGRDAASVYEEAEQLFPRLKEVLPATNESRQMLSHILALYPGHPDSKVNKIGDIAKGLRETRHALSRSRSIAMLGPLVGTDVPADELVRLIGAADDCLKEYKPFRGLFGTGRDTRRMFAVQMVLAALDEAGKTASADTARISSMISTSIEVTIITLIMLYSVMASASAAAASSASS